MCSVKLLLIFFYSNYDLIFLGREHALLFGRKKKQSRVRLLHVLDLTLEMEELINI